MTLIALLACAALGVLGGALSTVAGMGGGIALVALLSLFLGPHVALALTAPALLVGNAHRAFVFRDALDRKVGVAFVLGAIPGAAIGSLVVGEVPARVLTVALVVVTLFAIGRARGLFALHPPTWAWTPFAFGAGLVAAGSGAGVMVAPALVAGGLGGRALIATGALIALSMHVGRVAGYGLSGLYDVGTGGADLHGSLLLAVGLVAGNLVGVRLRARLGEAGTERVTELTLIGSLVLAVASLFR
jgi:uncharacterized membrane protein YfcA